MPASDAGALSASRVLVVGEALVDFRSDARTGAGVSELPGGSPLNIAVGLARLGVPTTLAAQVGTDARGEAVARHAGESGVELLRLTPERATSVARARIDASGMATYDFTLTWDPDGMPDPRGFDLVHVGSIGAALAPGADAVAGLAASAAAAGVPVSLDPNVRLPITPDEPDVRRRIDELITYATVVKLSDQDAETLWPTIAAEQAVLELAAQPGIQLGVLTRGAEGMRLCTAKQAVTVAAPAVVVVDTIGAGDTAMAALLAGLLTRRLLAAPPTRADLEWLGELAVSAAAVTCGRPGADPPWRAELPALSRRVAGSTG